MPEHPSTMHEPSPSTTGRRITSGLQAFRAVIDAQAAHFSQQVEEKGLASLRQGVEAMQRALHHALQESGQQIPIAAELDEAGVTSGELAPSDSASSPWSLESVRILRAELETGIVPAYGSMLDGSDMPAVLARSFRKWMQDLESSVASLPEVVDDPEPDTLFAGSDADTFWTGLRKGAVRLQRRISKPDGQPMRDIPFRRLGSAMQREWLLVQFGKIIDDDRRRLSRQLTRLEQALSSLLHAVLDREARLMLSVDAGSDGDPEGLAALPEKRLPVQSAVSLFSAALEQTAGELHCVAADTASRRVEQAWILLQAEVERSGSFMADVPSVTDELFDRRLEKIDGRASGWSEWMTRLRQRAAFFQAILLLRGAFDTVVADQGASIRQHLLEPIQGRADAAIEQLSGIEGRLSGSFQTGSAGLFEQGGSSLQALGEQAAEQVQSGLVDPLQELSLLSRITEENQALIEGLKTLQGELPEPYRMHPLGTDAEAFPDPSADERVVALREVVLNGLADVTEDRLAERTKPAREAFKEALDDLSDLTSIVRYSFRSAAESADDAAESSEVPADQQLDMVQGSLQRTRDAVVAIRDRIEKGVGLLGNQYREETLKSWIRIQDRLRVEHQVGAYVLDVRSRLDAEAREAGQRIFRVARQLRLLSERLLRRGHREARALIERGKEAVGTPTQSRASFHETALGLAELETVMERVPPVYRKLFSFQPLSDPDLLIGRSESSTFIEHHLQQFELGMPQAAVLIGGPSTGRTSLLNVLSATLLQDQDVRWLRINDRPESARELLERIRSELDIDIPDADSIPEAARKWLARDHHGPAPVCLVEHMETLMLRGIGGYHLLVDLLQFMSLTDSRIIWVGTVSSFAWQILKSANPDAVALVNQHVLADLSREDLERLIMERHRKSGVPLTFEEPEDMSPLLRRKLRNVRSRDMRQTVLKEAFFDRLYAQFGQNIQMALLQWIRSISVQDNGNRMVVSPTPALNLSFFSGFNLDQAFSLKALLEHGLLSPNEYAAIDRISRDRALTLFETLGNALIIESTEKREGGSMYRHTAVHADMRYRIRPLFTHAVVRLLRERNIVH